MTTHVTAYEAFPYVARYYEGKKDESMLALMHELRRPKAEVDVMCSSAAERVRIRIQCTEQLMRDLFPAHP